MSTILGMPAPSASPDQLGGLLAKLRMVPAPDERANGAVSVSTADEPCDFAVLGSLQVRGSGGRVSVGGSKEQTVLALLLAQANQAVSASSLIDGIWGEHPPRTAAKTLQGYVLRLRQSLEPDRSAGAAPVRLVTTGDGYQLRVSTADVDAGRFEQLLDRAGRQRSAGDWAGSAASLRTALALWRGEPYGAFLDAAACLMESERLTALCQTAHEDCIEADLAVGRAAAAVPELERLVTEHPFRERLWGLLIIGLYRCGRQADALRAYQRARKVLVDEMGIEPGPELRQLEAAVLAQDPALDVPSAGSIAARGTAGLPAALATVGPSFVGRGRELDILRAAVHHAATGHGGLAAVVGPEGVGKTRLVAELGRLADADGSPVCYARCFSGDSAVVAMLRQLLADRGLRPADVADSEGGLLGAGPTTRLAGFFAGWAVARPTLVIVDDVHESELAAQFAVDLGAACARLPVLVVATARGEGVMFPTVGRATIELGGLDVDEVLALGSLYHPERWSVADAEDVLRVTAGLPLAVHEVVSGLARASGSARLVRVVEEADEARQNLAAVQAGIAERVVSLQDVEARRRAHLRPVEPPARRELTDEPVVCPYKGLARFEAEDAPYFFGRERLVASLVARLVGARLLVVTGPSGSGKSSVVRAGLLAALAQGVLPGSEAWQVITLSPGQHPLAELERRVSAVDAHAARRVVFVDQFEELFGVDDSERAAFVARLLGLLADGPPTTAVLAVRTDELGRCAAYPELAEVMTGNDVLIGPMSGRELARAVEGPAERAGLQAEGGLTEMVIADVANRAGALPLLSTALFETWERRRGSTLTVAGYRDAGGVRGAVARFAESAYAELTAAQQRAARRILLHLADVEPDRPADIRRQVPVSEVLPDDDVETAAALDVLVSRRLLTLGGGTVEVTHEALLREWPRLREWLDADVEGRRLHQRLAAQAGQWEESGRHPAELLRGPRLSAVLEWVDTHADDLNARESGFVAESSAVAEQEAVDARRRADEQLRVNRRLRRRLVMVALIAAVAVVASGVALAQRTRAEAAARNADALRLAAAAVALPTDQLDRALLVSRQAWQLADSSETRAALLTLLLRSPQLDRFLPGLGAGVDGADVSADGSTIAVVTSDNTVRLFDPRTGRPQSTFPITQTGHTLRVVISPDGRTIATLGGDATVRLWDRNGHALGSPLGTGPTGSIAVTPAVPSGAFLSRAAFSPDGRHLATIDETGHGLVWDVATHRPLGELPVVDLPAQKVDVAFSRDGTRLAVAAAPSVVVDATTQKTVFVVPRGTETGGDTSVAFSADGRVLATASGSEIRLWDLASGRAVRPPLEAGTDVTQIQFSPDGDRLAAGTASGTTLVWDARTFEALGPLLAGQQGPVSQVEFVPGTPRLVTATGSSVAVWDTGSTGPLLADLLAPATPGGAAVASVAFSPDGRSSAALTTAGNLEVWRSSAQGQVGSAVALPAPPPGTQGTALAFDSNGQLAVGRSDGSILVVGLNTGAQARLIVQVGGGGVTGLAFARARGLLAAGTTDGRIVLLSSRSWTVRRVLTSRQSGSVTSVAFSPDGRLVASGGINGDLILDGVDDARSSDLATRTSEKITGVAYRPDGRLVAAGYSDGLALLVEPPDGVRSTPLTASPQPVTAVAFSPNGRLLAIGAADGTFTLWDGRALRRLGPSLIGAVSALAFSPSGRQLITGGADDATAIWNVDPAAWAARACTLAGRALSRQEWDQLLPGRSYRPACRGGAA